MHLLVKPTMLNLELMSQYFVNLVLFPNFCFLLVAHDFVLFRHATQSDSLSQYFFISFLQLLFKTHLCAKVSCFSVEIFFACLIKGLL